jgi:hypothetical protein
LSEAPCLFKSSSLRQFKRDFIGKVVQIMGLTPAYAFDGGADRAQMVKSGVMIAHLALHFRKSQPRAHESNRITGRAACLDSFAV